MSRNPAAALRAVDISEQAADHFNNPETAGKLFIPDARPTTYTAAIGNTVGFSYASIDDAFPPVDPGLRPFGNLVLCQVRKAKTRTAGGIDIPDEMLATEQYNTQVAKVIALGPLAFHNRNTGELWPEGAWTSVGAFVRVPKYQGERWIKNFQRKGINHRGFEEDVTDEVTFVLFKDLALLGEFTEDPLTIRAYL